MIITTDNEIIAAAFQKCAEKIITINNARYLVSVGNYLATGNESFWQFELIRKSPEFHNATDMLEIVANVDSLPIVDAFTSVFYAGKSFLWCNIRAIIISTEITTLPWGDTLATFTFKFLR